MADKLHIWNPMDLALALRHDELSETTAVKHLIVFSVIFSGVAAVPVGPVSGDTSSLDTLQGFLEFGLYAVIVYYGTWYAHQSNSKGDGKFFFRRFVALTLPISVQLLVYGLPIFMGAWILLASVLSGTDYLPPGDGLQNILLTVGGTVWSIAFYYLMGKYIGLASSRTDS